MGRKTKKGSDMGQNPSVWADLDREFLEMVRAIRIRAQKGGFQTLSGPKWQVNFLSLFLFRFLPMLILTDVWPFYLTDTDTDFCIWITYRYRFSHKYRLTDTDYTDYWSIPSFFITFKCIFIISMNFNICNKSLSHSKHFHYIDKFSPNHSDKYQSQGVAIKSIN